MKNYLIIIIGSIFMAALYYMSSYENKIINIDKIDDLETIKQINNDTKSKQNKSHKIENFPLDDTTLVQTNKMNISEEQSNDYSFEENDNKNTEANSDYDATFEADWVSEDNTFNQDELRKATASHYSFESYMNQLSEKAINSEKSQENKFKYENYFYNQPEYDDNKVSINRMECGEKICMVAVNFDNQASINSYIKNIQSFRNSNPIQSIASSIDEDSHIANLIFSAQKNTKMLKVN